MRDHADADQAEPRIEHNVSHEMHRVFEAHRPKQAKGLPAEQEHNPHGQQSASIQLTQPL